MKEMPVDAGRNIGAVLRQLLKEAPAFCIFNDIRIEAHEGETLDQVGMRYDAVVARFAAANEARDSLVIARAGWRFMYLGAFAALRIPDTALVDPDISKKLAALTTSNEEAIKTIAVFGDTEHDNPIPAPMH